MIRLWLYALLGAAYILMRFVEAMDGLEFAVNRAKMRASRKAYKIVQKVENGS